MPGVIWIYDVTHVTAAGRCAVAVLDMVSPQENSTQVEVAFTCVLIADGKDHLLG